MRAKIKLLTKKNGRIDDSTPRNMTQDGELAWISRFVLPAAISYGLAVIFAVIPIAEISQILSLVQIDESGPIDIMAVLRRDDSKTFFRVPPQSFN